MPTPAALPPLEAVQDSERASLLLHPLRQKILSEAREASTAAEIARRVGLPPQKVNYHVRTLADAGFLRPVGEGRKRNLIEKRYRSSARSYVLLSHMLGEMGPGALSEADRFSASHLMGLSSLLQEELAVWLASGRAPEESVPTLSIDAEIRFESSDQRAAFADALQEAVTRVVSQYTAAHRDPKGRRRPGRTYRLVVGCYPVPDDDGGRRERPAEPERRR